MEISGLLQQFIMISNNLNFSSTHMYISLIWGCKLHAPNIDKRYPNCSRIVPDYHCVKFSKNSWSEFQEQGVQCFGPFWGLHFFSRYSLLWPLLTHIALALCKMLKKSLEQIQRTKEMSFLGQKRDKNDPFWATGTLFPKM